MWFTLLREFRPSVCLQIGVYRGQVISLWTLIANLLNFSCEVHGISPFAPVGDSVSRYPEEIDYWSDTLASFELLGLNRAILVPALSTDAAALQHIASKNWDLIYIDGSHDYEVVLSDYRNSVTPESKWPADHGRRESRNNVPPTALRFCWTSGPLTRRIRNCDDGAEIPRRCWAQQYICEGLRPDLDSRTGFRHREWPKCWRLIKPGQKCGAKL